MKRAFVFLCAVILVLSMTGPAAALLYIEEFTGLQDLSPGEGEQFFFDFYEPGTSVTNQSTTSCLSLTSDVVGLLDPWDSARVLVDVWDPEGDGTETGRIRLLLDLAGNQIIKDFTVDVAPHTQFTYDLTDADLADLRQYMGHDYAAVSVTCLPTSDSAFTLGSVAMQVNAGAPVPEFATMLLLGTGLVGLAGFSKKFKK